MASIPDILYKGIPRKFTRGYTAELIKKIRPERVVIPCTGAFALATCAVSAGVRPDQIESCDITLYSAVIGAMLMEQDIRVSPRAGWEWAEEYMGDPVGRVAAIVFAIRLLQYQSKKDSIFIHHKLRELMERRDAYIQQARVSAETLKKNLSGLVYHTEDMWDLLARHHEDDPGTLLLVNPPRYTGGFDIQFKGVETAFDWDDPYVTQFEETDYPRLMEYLGPGPRALVYYATRVKTAINPAHEWGAPWQSVFAARPRSGVEAAINWIASNKPDVSRLQRSDIEVPVKAKYKLFDGEIKPDSVLQVIRESREVVSYYRDLLVHRLALANSERYQVLLLDGRLLACMGFVVKEMRGSNTTLHGVPKLSFAFSVNHSRYSRLHKLTLLSVASTWLWKVEMGDLEKMPHAVQTTMLTRYPEVKTARGIFELRGREQNKKTGEFMLRYYAPVIERSALGTVQEWLRKWGQNA